MPPVADADVDQVVPIDPKTGKANVQFNGSNSHDPDVGTNPGDGIDSYASVTVRQAVARDRCIPTIRRAQHRHSHRHGQGQTG